MEGWIIIGFALNLDATDLTLGQPSVHGGARKARELTRELQVRQAACEEVVNRADGYAQARGKLLLVLVVPHWRLTTVGNR